MQNSILLYAWNIFRLKARVRYKVLNQRPVVSMVVRNFQSTHTCLEVYQFAKSNSHVCKSFKVIGKLKLVDLGRNNCYSAAYLNQSDGR